MIKLTEVFRWAIIAGLLALTIGGVIYCEDVIAKVAVICTVGFAFTCALVLKLQGKW